MVFLFSSISPCLFILYLVYRHDLEKEPKKMLVKAFFGGVLSILVSFFFSIPFGIFAENMNIEGPFFSAFFEAAIAEELAKWLIFYWFIKKAKHFDQFYDGILYAIFISMGFALVENILYVYEGGIGVAFFRAVLAVPGHMLFAVPMGYYLSLAKFESGRDLAKHTFFSLAIPILLHGTYDFILMSTEKIEKFPGLILVLLIAFVLFEIYLWRYGLKKIRLHINRDKNNAT